MNGTWQTRRQLRKLLRKLPWGLSVQVHQRSRPFVPADVFPLSAASICTAIGVNDGPGFNFNHRGTCPTTCKLQRASARRRSVHACRQHRPGRLTSGDRSRFARYVISQRQFYMRCDLAKVIPAFIAIYFRSPGWRTGCTSSWRTLLSIGDPLNRPARDVRDATIRIPLPPLHEQRAIAHILGTLDAKIELNRRMNQTLEEVARALFKSGFVDLAPGASGDVAKDALKQRALRHHTAPAAELERERRRPRRRVDDR